MAQRFRAYATGRGGGRTRTMDFDDVEAAKEACEELADAYGHEVAVEDLETHEEWELDIDDRWRWVRVERELHAVLATEDIAEDAGHLEPDDRRTCHSCRAWATEEHLRSEEHQRGVVR